MAKLTMFRITIVCLIYNTLSFHMDHDRHAPSEVAILGETVTLECPVYKAHHTIIWVEYLLQEENIISINETKLQHIRDLTNYTVIFTESGIYKLIIASVSFRDAGSYSCIDKTAGERVFMKLQVIDNSPSCITMTPYDKSPNDIQNKTVVYSDTLKFSCTIRYKYGQQPEMQWVLDDTITKAQIYIVTSNTNGILWDTARVTFNMPASRKHSSTPFQCLVTVMESGEQPTNPNWSNSCQTANLNIMVPANDIVLHPRKEFYEIGDRIWSTARGNPVPEIKWHYTDGKPIESFSNVSHNLMIIKYNTRFEMANSIILEIIVNNTIMGNSYKVTDKIVVDNSSGLDKVLVYFVMAIAVLGLLAVFSKTGKTKIKSELLIDHNMSSRKKEYSSSEEYYKR